MKTYRVTSDKATIGQGAILDLAPGQINPRIKKLSPVEGDNRIYEVNSPVVFKRGEEFGGDNLTSTVLTGTVKAVKEPEENKE